MQLFITINAKFFEGKCEHIGTVFFFIFKVNKKADTGTGYLVSCQTGYPVFRVAGYSVLP